MESDNNEQQEVIHVTEHEIALHDRINRELELNPSLQEEFKAFMATLSVEDLVKYGHPIKLACVFELHRVMKRIRNTHIEERMRQLKAMTLKANAVQQAELLRLHQDLKRQKDLPLEKIR